MNKLILDNVLIYYQVFFKKIRHMYLRIENGQIIINCNKNTKKKDIEKFIFNKKDWILKRINKAPIHLYNLSQMYLWGNIYSVIINEKQRKYIQHINDTFILNTKKINKTLIEKFYKEKLLEKIANLIKSNQQWTKLNVDVNNIKFKSQLMKTRYGSCIRQKKVIKINSLLARFDQVYLEMVLAHELVHLSINNHSKRFYIELNKLCPNHREINKKLKTQTQNIYR